MSTEVTHEHGGRGGASSHYYTVAEAAQQLGVSHSTVWRWIEAGRLPAYRVGPKTIRIEERDLARVIAPVGQTKRAAGAAVRVAGPTLGRVLAGPRTAPLTDDEVARRLAALEQAAASRRAQLASRGGVPFSSSTELVRETREELGER
jgi:excisionase family DNA binding protein